MTSTVPTYGIAEAITLLDETLATFVRETDLPQHHASTPTLAHHRREASATARAHQQASEATQWARRVQHQAVLIAVGYRCNARHRCIDRRSTADHVVHAR